MGASPQLARRVGIAVYEAEINLIIHTNEGGIIRAEIEPHRISIRVFDNGPGIENVELAMQPGYSTATEESENWDLAQEWDWSISPAVWIIWPSNPSGQRNAFAHEILFGRGISWGRNVTE